MKPDIRYKHWWQQRSSPYPDFECRRSPCVSRPGEAHGNPLKALHLFFRSGGSVSFPMWTFGGVGGFTGVSSVPYLCYIDQTLCSGHQFAAHFIYQLTRQEEGVGAPSARALGGQKGCFAGDWHSNCCGNFLVRVSPICVYDLVRVSL